MRQIPYSSKHSTLWYQKGISLSHLDSPVHINEGISLGAWIRLALVELHHTPLVTGQKSAQLPQGPDEDPVAEFTSVLTQIFIGFCKFHVLMLKSQCYMTTTCYCVTFKLQW